MRQFLPDPLTRGEFAALKQIDDAMEYETIPVEIRERLILIGMLRRSMADLSSRMKGCCE
jgi:hypothetical protein